jgi:hypothetical protein
VQYRNLTKFMINIFLLSMIIAPCLLPAPCSLLAPCSLMLQITHQLCLFCYNYYSYNYPARGHQHIHIWSYVLNFLAIDY